MGRGAAGSRLAPGLQGAFARSVSGVFALQVVFNGLSVITGILLGRFLGPQGYGAYVFALGWVAVLSVPAVVGLDKVLVRMVPSYEVERSPALLHGLFRRADQVVLVAATAIAAGAALLGAVVLSSDFRGPFLIAMILLPVMALTFVRLGGMTGLGRVVLGQVPEFVLQPVSVIIALVLVRLALGDSMTAVDATIVTVGGGTLACMVGRVMLWRAIPSEVKHARPQYDTREWLRLGLPMMLVAGIWLLDAYAATIIAGAVGGAHVVGIFAVCARGGQVVALVLTAVNTPLAPRIARLYALGDQREAQRVVSKTATASFAFALPIALVLILLRHPLLSLFGHGFASGGTALVIIVAGQLVNAATGPAATVLSMTGYANAAAVGVAAGLVINVGLCAALVPSMGVVGAAVANACGTTVRNLVMVVIAKRKLGLDTSIFPTSGSGGPATHWRPAHPGIEGP